MKRTQLTPELKKAAGGMVMERPTKAELEALRAFYPKGTRIRLIKMDDPQAPPRGTLGTVQGLDDIGDMMVNWDNGSTLNLIYREDVIVRVKENAHND